MKVSIKVFLGVIVVSALGLGWVSGEIPDSQISQLNADRWDVRIATLSQTEKSFMGSAEFETFLTSGFIPIPVNSVESGRKEEIDRLEVSQAFPQIAGAAIVNGQGQVHIITDGQIQAMKAGDRLSSGWNILSVNMNQVIAERAGETSSFPVVDYHNAGTDNVE